jgi:RNA polymerase sigma factor (sigma-70 family)
MDVAALFTQHRDAVFRYLARYTGDADLAEDLVQETFVKLAERPPKNPELVRSWLFVVATNLARDARKTSRRRSELARLATEDSPAAADPAPDPAALVEVAELRDRVRAALQRLSDKERTALLLREEGFTHREIAAAIGATTGSVGTLVARALAKLSEGLDNA